MSNTYATAIHCMDGRIQIPVIEYIRSKCAVDYVKMITEPGPNKILPENVNRTSIESIERSVAISIEVHNSKLIAIVGHNDCAGNSAGKETQLSHILASINTIKSWEFAAQVVGLWGDEKWGVAIVAE